MSKRILSGMRPTGPLHLGHLLGAVTNWTKFQDEYECFFMVADWHAHMSEYAQSKSLAQHSLEMVADWIACGIDPKKSVIFIQSRVPEHATLQVILGNITPLGWLERCPTYKDQLREITTRDLATYGFLGYPVLQAADIVLYKAHAVPVGGDQLAHLELTREIVRKFHFLYDDIFPEPEAILSKTPRLLGLDNRKMSKSLDNYIGLGEDADTISAKVMKMITDPARIKKTDSGHPDICNVCRYYEMFASEQAARVAHECRAAERGCIACKKALAEAVSAHLAPIREKRATLLDDKAQLKKIITDGTARARDVARQTMREVNTVIGFY